MPPSSSVAMPANGSDLIMLIPVHVDDGLAATNSPSLWQWLICELNKSFEISDLSRTLLGHPHHLRLCTSHSLSFTENIKQNKFVFSSFFP
jgi:hypothetical protein